MKINQILEKHEACPNAQHWADGKTWQEIYTTCHRGDWLLWLFARTNPDDLQILTLAKGHCANTFRHLMKDPRSIKAVDTAIAFGEGKATREQLDAASADGYAAAVAYAADGAAAAAYAAFAAFDAAAYAAAAAADKKDQQLTADICRKYLPIQCWNIEP